MNNYWLVCSFISFWHFYWGILQLFALELLGIGTAIVVGMKNDKELRIQSEREILRFTQDDITNATTPCHSERREESRLGRHAVKIVRGGE